MRGKRIIVTLLLAMLLFVGIGASNVFAGNSCARFATCSGPADCAWWGTHCAADAWYEFIEIVDTIYW